MEKLYIFFVITGVYLLFITLSFFSKNRKIELFFFTIALVLMTISIYYPLFFSGWYKLLFIVGLLFFWLYCLKEEQIKKLLIY